ncbi:hypothetical protein GNE08_17540 [Trichormus variabilis ARAD]|uniref:Uncharacterized protein n=1 Tax=Trichormus variabilis N2B TaxID=2681315 RepID=A0ABR6S6Z5_ANAVA|nr:MULTISPECIES: hypothetical protein [Nostocaceae]MBC1216027.1 hypothetical protein [Trichormus variabilis ARAD]MBC1254680.1 hypothetical protein [Trichormus variabilis V5]MBC1267894.1 hypothetical protein [Trichormus variabilis FSR]MBC1302167.1 hypothetical protein [Trichormus variabilis N2B]MBC1313935.1 hypothetical protein [Trichormus variabilis PNB]
MRRNPISVSYLLSFWLTLNFLLCPLDDVEAIAIFNDNGFYALIRLL